VALCLQNRVAATLIDATTLSDENSWSLALSLKAVSPDTPVLLITPGRSTAVRVPPGVDCMASAEDPQLILDALKRVRRVNAAPSRKVSAHSCLET
jgi:hypothetical protein